MSYLEYTDALISIKKVKDTYLLFSYDKWLYWTSVEAELKKHYEDGNSTEVKKVKEVK